jgi:hypothetical protein
VFTDNTGILAQNTAGVELMSVRVIVLHAQVERLNKTCGLRFAKLLPARRRYGVFWIPAKPTEKLAPWIAKLRISL